MGSVSRHNREEYSFDSNQCQTCLNTNVINNTVDTDPIEVCSSGNNPAVIIPHLLGAALSSYKYTILDIYSLIVAIKNRLVRILTKWSKNGVNPCNKNKLGYKTILPLKNGFKLDCWVIVDQITTHLAYRLVYGGNKIQCPP